MYDWLVRGETRGVFRPQRAAAGITHADTSSKQHPVRAPVVVRRRPARVRRRVPRRHALPQVAERRRHVLVHGHGRVLWRAELGQGRDDGVGRDGVEPDDRLPRRRPPHDRQRAVLGLVGGEI